MAFDTSWSGNFFTFSGNNNIAIFNQSSNDVMEGLDYHLYPCARLNTPFYGPFRVLLTCSARAWFGIGLPTCSPNGFEPYKGRAWFTNTELQYFMPDKANKCAWISYFGSALTLQNCHFGFGNGSDISNQTLVFTCNPQEKWMLVTANDLQVKYDLEGLNGIPSGGLFFMVSLCGGRVELISASALTISPQAITQVPWTCNRHRMSEHHFFISYRVASESALAHRIFSELELKRKGTTVFLDANCLPHAMDWRQSFEYGLKKSRVIILLISEFSCQKIKDNAAQYADNVLLEMELALIRRKSEPAGTVAVFPVFVGTNPTVQVNGKDTEVFAKCAVPSAHTFPALPHNRPISLPGAPATIQDTIAEVLMLNGVFVNPKDNLFELLHMLFTTLEKVNSVRKEYLVDPCNVKV